MIEIGPNLLVAIQVVAGVVAFVGFWWAMSKIY